MRIFVIGGRLGQMWPRGGEPIIVPFWKLAFKPKWLAGMAKMTGKGDSSLRSE
jgi:hypothetical protein